MLISYSIKNYRSIADQQILSFAPMNRQKEYFSNILSEGDSSALNVVAVYGANASGKSNLIRGLSSFIRLLRNSAMETSISGLDYQPFLLRQGYDKKPTQMELVFTIDERRYRYGFEYNSTEIVKEWLLKKDVGRESPLFEREGDTIEPSSPLSSNKKLVELAIDATRSNGLFLSVCDALNIDEAKKIISYLGNMSLINGTSPSMLFRTNYHIRLWQEESYSSALQGLFSRMDVDIKEISFQKDESFYDIKTKHSLYDFEGKATGELITLDMFEHESSGTQQAFRLSGPVIRSLLSGGILVIDEIESKLHPVMTLRIIDLFLDKETNLKGAQLLFTTHDTNLLTYANLRRDQICFMEKNSWESSELFSLSDFVYYGEKDGQIIPEKERVDTDKEKRYIEGRYGAIPMLGEFKEYVKSLWQNEGK